MLGRVASLCFDCFHVLSLQKCLGTHQHAWKIGIVICFSVTLDNLSLVIDGFKLDPTFPFNGDSSSYPIKNDWTA